MHFIYITTLLDAFYENPTRDIGVAAECFGVRVCSPGSLIVYPYSDTHISYHGKYAACTLYHDRNQTHWRHDTESTEDIVLRN